MKKTYSIILFFLPFFAHAQTKVPDSLNTLLNKSVPVNKTDEVDFQDKENRTVLRLCFSNNKVVVIAQSYKMVDHGSWRQEEVQPEVYLPLYRMLDTWFLDTEPAQKMNKAGIDRWFTKIMEKTRTPDH